jgi:hypothetical protein
MGFENGFAKQNLLVSVGKGRVRGRAGDSQNGIVKSPETLLKAVGIALVMPAWIAVVIPSRPLQ